MSSYSKCKNCGADYGLHHYETSQCPAGGVEAPVGKEQIWMTTTFEDCPAPKPARPTGPTLEYVRELEETLLALKEERDRFMELCRTIQLWAEDETQELPVTPFWYSPLCEALLDSALAAANEAQP